MKKLVSLWLLFTSVGMLFLSIAVSGATESPSSSIKSTGAGKEGGTPGRPALRGAHALGPFTPFDTNHDGIISAEEIADAATSLRKLDKNGDGQLTANELRPSRPPHDREGERGEGEMPPPQP